MLSTKHAFTVAFASLISIVGASTASADPKPKLSVYVSPAADFGPVGATKHYAKGAYTSTDQKAWELVLLNPCLRKFADGIDALPMKPEYAKECPKEKARYNLSVRVKARTVDGSSVERPEESLVVPWVSAYFLSVECTDGKPQNPSKTINNPNDAFVTGESGPGAICGKNPTNAKSVFTKGLNDSYLGLLEEHRLKEEARLAEEKRKQEELHEKQRNNRKLKNATKDVEEMKKRFSKANTGPQPNDIAGSLEKQLPSHPAIGSPGIVPEHPVEKTDDAT